MRSHVLTIGNLAFGGVNVVYARASDDATNALVRVTNNQPVFLWGADPGSPVRKECAARGANDKKLRRGLSVCG